ncbi:hypothetical protein BC332_12588 [Capsicum chinense]|nr:hypothetical protein BC332_12588 [Capsicum chinense]
MLNEKMEEEQDWILDPIQALNRGRNCGVNGVSVGKLLLDDLVYKQKHTNMCSKRKERRNKMKKGIWMDRDIKLSSTFTCGSNKYLSSVSFQKQMQNFDITLPQEQQPAEMVDRREEQPPEMVDRLEVNPAEMADRQEEQPPEMVDSRPTEMVDRQEVNPAEMADRREEQPAGMEDRRGQEEPRPVDTPEINTHFFKIILSPHASKLHIPSEFIAEYGASLGDAVSLEIPNGVVWKVKLQKNSDGMVWLKEGWNKFKEYYTIACGYFLLFRYKGNSQFSVFIFDLTSTEIEYPPGPNDEDTTPDNRSVAFDPTGPNEDTTPDNRSVAVDPPGPNEATTPDNRSVAFDPPGPNEDTIPDNRSVAVDLPGPNEATTPDNPSVAFEPPEENRINLPLSSEPPDENVINSSLPIEPRVENVINLPPPREPPEENAINLPPPGIYTMEELSRAFMLSQPKV